MSDFNNEYHIISKAIPSLESNGLLYTAFAIPCGPCIVRALRGNYADSLIHSP
jgi:hypothetical protein